MSRLNAIADRLTGAAFGLTNYNNLEADVNWLAIPGANLAAATTLTVTNEFHIVTGTTTIANLTDALGSISGQQVRLLFQAALTIQNNGGGSGNIRMLNGADRTVRPNETVVFLYDASASVWRETGPGAPQIKTTSKIVNNSTTETDLLNGEITVGAGGLGPTGKLRLRVFVDYLNNTGGAATFRWRLKFGATTVFDSGTLSVGANTPRFPLEFEARAINLGATNSQVWNGVFQQTTNTSAAAGWGVGEGNSSGGTMQPWLNTSAEDTTVGKALQFTVQMGIAAVNAEAKLAAAVLEF